jgi:spore coat protein CotF
VINEEDNFKYYVDQITTEENPKIRQQLKDALQAQRESYQHELKNLINSMHRFQHNLIKIVEQG